MTGGRLLTVSMLGTLPPLKALSPYCLGLATALDAAGVRLFFHSFSSLYPAWLYPTKEKPEDATFVKFHTRHMKIYRRLAWYNPLSWINAGVTMKTDVFHVQWWSLPTLPTVAVMMAIARLKHIPIVTTIHNAGSHEPSFLFDQVTRLIAFLSDHLIVHSHHNKNTLRRKIKAGSDDISVIPHGPLSLFKSGSQNFRQAKGIRDDEKVLLFFGNIRPYKGLDVLIEAMSAVKAKSFFSLRLVIAGSLWEPWDRYERLIQKLGLENEVIQILGYVPSDQVGALFSAADLVVLPYRHFDSQSGVGAAAIAFHVPMIVTDTGGLSDLVSDPACVVPCGDPDTLAEKILAVLSDDRLYQKLKHDAAKIENAMSWEHIANQTISLYHRFQKEKDGAGQ
jgi:glycosyltransferase involved in cell wall biosynthesis